MVTGISFWLRVGLGYTEDFCHKRQYVLLGREVLSLGGCLEVELRMAVVCLLKVSMILGNGERA